MTASLAKAIHSLIKQQNTNFKYKANFPKEFDIKYS